MIEIPLTKGKVAIIDDCDSGALLGNKWIAHTDGYNWYAMRNPHKNGVRKYEALHRHILGELCKDKVVDHINGDGLDNRRCNLRVCDSGGNAMNRRPRKEGISRFKGVGRKMSRGKFWKWCVYIQYEGRRKCVGYFDSEEAAALAYNAAAKTVHGEFAYQNAI